MLDSLDNIANAASQAALAVAQMILTNDRPLTGGQLMRNPKQPTQRTFTAGRENQNSLPICSHHCQTMQITTFANKRMKIYVLLVHEWEEWLRSWPVNETTATLANTSTIQHLEDSLMSSKDFWRPG